MLKGRRKIISDFKSEDLMDRAILIKCLNTSRLKHLQNKTEIDYLVNYKNGVQPVLDRTKIVRDEINNTVVLNHAQMVTRNVIGYFLGNPIQYIQNGFI